MSARILAPGIRARLCFYFALTLICTTFIAPVASAAPLALPISNFWGAVGTHQLQLNATGGTPPYTYSLTPGASNVPGLRVRNRPYPMPTSFPASTTGGYLGVLNTPGVFPTSIRVTDSVGAFVDKAIQYTVVEFQNINSTPPRPVLGVAYDFALKFFGLTGTASYSATGMPPGLSVNSSGHVVGTPTTAGTYAPTITTTDSGTGAARNNTLSFVVKPFDITTDGELPDATANAFYSVTFQAPACLSCVFSTTSILPSGLSLQANGVLSGTATGTNSGLTINVTATGTNGAATKTFSLKILNSVLQPLSVAVGPTVTSSVGSTSSVALFASGGTPPYAWSVESGTLPPGISLQGPGETLGASLLPGFQYLLGGGMEVGTYTFTLKVTDAVGVTASRELTWNVSKLALSFTSLPITGTTLTTGAPYTQRLLGLGGSGIYTWTALGIMPGGLTLDPTTGTISGTPTDTGSYTVSIQLADTNGNAFTTNIFLNITGPTATAPSIIGPGSPNLLSLGGSLNVTLTGTGGTGPYTFTALTPLPPGFALLSGSASTVDGSVMLGGVATRDGTFDYTLQIKDSLNNVGVRTFRMIVSQVTILTSSLQNGTLGVFYSQRLLGGSPNGPLTWSLDTGFSLPPGLTLGSGGRISGTPTEESSNTLTFVATDPLGNRATRSLTLTISNLSIGGPDILPAGTSGVPYNYVFTATGAVGSLTWSSNSLPLGLMLSSGGTLSGTPDLGTLQQSSLSLSVTATDGVRRVTRRFTLNVVPPTPFLLGGTANPLLADALVGQGINLSLGTVGGVPPVTFAVAVGSTLPQGLQLFTGDRVFPTAPPGTTVIAGAPTAAGNYTFDIVATDSTGAQTVRTYSLHVSNIFLPTSIRTPRVGEAYAYQFTAVGGTGPYTFDPPISTDTNAPALPPGLTLSASGLLSGTPTSSGTYPFRLTVHDNAGNTFGRGFTLSVADFINGGGSGGLLIPSLRWPDASVGVWVDWSLSLQRSNASCCQTATWSIVGGSLPPGVSLIGDKLEGRPSTPGTYVFRVRGNDVASPSQYAEREIPMRVSPMQIVRPALEFSFDRMASLPNGEVGTAYSHQFKVAGGTTPYTFSQLPYQVNSTTSPIPAGLTLSPSGLLSGTPTQSGTYLLGFVVTDALGEQLIVQATTNTGAAQISLTIAPPGGHAPLMVDDETDADVPFSLGVDAGTSFIARLDNLVQSGVAPFQWSVAPGSSLPPGLAIVSGGGVVSDIVAGKPTQPGTYSFTLNVVDGAGQVASAAITNVRVIDLALAPLRVPPGNVGTPYTATLTLAGGSPPYGPVELGDGSSLPPGLTLSPAGVLSGTPTAAGNFLFAVFVSDLAHMEYFLYRLTIDNAAGEAKGVSLSPSVIEVSQPQGAPGSTIPLTINITHGAPAFTAVITGVPGATLSATSGNAPATLDVNLNLSALPTGTYHGLVGVSVPGAANLYDVTPITVIIGPAPVVQAIAVAPDTGSGVSQIFTLTYSDSAGVSTDLSGAFVSFTSVANPMQMCRIHYRATTGQVRFMDDAGVWSEFTPFGSGTLSNSQCAVNWAGSSATANGTNLTLAWNITFMPAFVGPTTILMRAQSLSGPNTGFVQRGTWTVGAIVDAASITPNSGTGMAQTFTAVFTDSLGVSADLKGARVRFVSASGTLCQIDYNAVTNPNQVRLLDDTLNWSAFTPFGGGVLDNNSQCSLDLAQSSATANGTTLTLALRVVFKAAFVGPTTIQMRAVSNFGGTNTGWVARGSWTVGADVQAIAISPNSGTGSVQSFVLTYSDSEGVTADLKAARVRFVDPVSGARCQIDYNAMTNQVRMLSDLLEWSGDFPLGGFGTLDNNSQCSLNLSQSTATPNGTNLTVVLGITFKPAFFGLKNIDMRANSSLGSTTGWVTRGTWTPFAGVAVLDFETTATGLSIVSTPVITSHGTITASPVGGALDILPGSGGTGNILLHDQSTEGQYGQLAFDFDVSSITFNFDGYIAGQFSAQVLDAGFNVLDSFFDSDTNGDFPGGPVTLSGSGIRYFRFLDPDPTKTSAGIDNVTISTAGTLP